MMTKKQYLKLIETLKGMDRMQMLNYLDCHKLQHNNVFHGRFIEEV